MRAYYGSRFSPNMTTTPEGFLICHNVPIARTGWYEYLGREIGLDDQPDTIVNVYRSPDVVFSPAAMASFEGKILTDEHPTELVTPDNAMRYTKGTVQNVRQGKGEESDLLLADLVVYDQYLIDEIKAGKREVSCGYDCTYTARGDGTYEQQQICGNHVAVVKSGRAGDRVAIKDSKAETKGEGRMKLKPPKKQARWTDLLAAVGLKQFATDAEPEEIMDAVSALAEERAANDEDPEEQPPKTVTGDDGQDPAIAALAAQVNELTNLVKQLAQGGAQKPAAPEDAIDAAIAELESQQPTGDNEEEESHTIPAASMDEEGPVSESEDRPQSAMDNAYRIEALKAMKPIIAAIPDPAQRKIAADAAIAAIKSKPAKNTYADIAKAQKKKAMDEQSQTSSQTVDHSQLGKEWAKKYNPHYKNRA